MKVFSRKPHPEQTQGEEIVNTISHGLGVVAAIAAAPFLIYYAAAQGDPLVIAGASVFITTVILLYLTSTLFHGLKKGNVKNWFQLFDHIAIFLLIAGTYTPFTLGVLQGTIGWVMLAVIWAVAIIGITLRIISGNSNMRLFVVFYLLMGWLIIIPIKPLINGMEPAGLLWIAAGGAAYTLGVIFYILPRRYYAHFVWHLFVLMGTASHFMAVMFYSY
jgi:hemolysin III